LIEIAKLKQGVKFQM